MMIGCKDENKTLFLVGEIPDDEPITFKQELVPANKIIHRGIFSPDMKEYYFTVSDQSYRDFDVWMIKKENEKWSRPQKAFFNGEYSEHGMSFSPDGETLYFSSIRPVPMAGVAATWHLWKSEKGDGTWSEPEFVDIPNLRDKLVSHPSVAKSGTVYFHVSNLDYSSMDIYYSKQLNGHFGDAEKLKIANDPETLKATPCISPDEYYLVFASVGNQLDLMICFNDGNGGWTNLKKLDPAINSQGQGNPYVSPDGHFLFFATGKHLGDWSIRWIRFEPKILGR